MWRLEEIVELAVEINPVKVESPPTPKVPPIVALPVSVRETAISAPPSTRKCLSISTPPVKVEVEVGSEAKKVAPACTPVVVALPVTKRSLFRFVIPSTFKVDEAERLVFGLYSSPTDTSIEKLIEIRLDGTLDVYKACVLDKDGVMDGCVSSIEYKKNILDLDFDKEALLQLRPVSFVWNEKSLTSEKSDIGLIAEEVDLLVPELVKYTNGKATGMKYDKLSLFSLEIIKEHDTEIADLKKEIEELRGMIKNQCSI